MSRALNIVRATNSQYPTEKLFAILRNSIRCQHDGIYMSITVMVMRKKFPETYENTGALRRLVRQSKITEALAVEELMRRGLGRLEIEALRSAAKALYRET
jgi:hypothetical protein